MAPAEASQSNRKPAPRHGASQPKAPRTRLAVVNARQLKARAQRRRARAIFVVAASIVVGSLLLVAATQAQVASQQVRIDNVAQTLSSAVAQNEDLQLARAQLATPARVLKIAEHELGMVSPSNVHYLTPVNPGPTVAQAGMAALK